jgi:holo-[acyl-carrier protein] synthase
MLGIRIGHDLQRIGDLAGRDSLRLPGVFFTEDECCYLAKKSIESVAGFFSAKEAVFKALPEIRGFCWSDIEINLDPNGAPRLTFYGPLQRFMQEHALAAHLSISHSGDYVSSVVLISQAAPGLGKPASPPISIRETSR